MSRAETLRGWLFASPWILGFCAFTGLPLALSLWYSFTSFDLIHKAHWVGLANYAYLLHSHTFWVSMYDTAYYSMGVVVLQLALGLSIAMLLNFRSRGSGLLRTIYYLPAVTSGVAVALLWGWLLDPTAGLIDQFLRSIGLPGPLWLGSPHWAKPAFILMSVWGIGPTIVLFIAALQGVRSELVDAARVDGATSWRVFLHIVLPAISPMMLFVLVVSVIGSFQVFIPAYVLTGGGPVHSTYFAVLRIYQLAFQYLQFGQATAMAWLMVLMLLAITGIQFALSGRWVYYAGDHRR